MGTVIEKVPFSAFCRSAKYGLWVSGGETSNGSLLDTTEAMESPGSPWTGKGPKLPGALSRHCLIKISETYISATVSYRAAQIFWA